LPALHAVPDWTILLPIIRQARWRGFRQKADSAAVIGRVPWRNCSCWQNRQNRNPSPTKGGPYWRCRLGKGAIVCRTFPPILIIKVCRKSIVKEPALSALDHWHPLLPAKKLRRQPVAVRLAGKDLVLFRTSQGVAALEDRCPHRRMKLSRGSCAPSSLLDYDAVVCAGARSQKRPPQSRSAVSTHRVANTK